MMENIKSIHLCIVMACMTLAVAAPTRDEKIRSNYAHWFSELRKPINELSQKTKNIEVLYQTSKTITNWQDYETEVDREYRSKCEQKISNRFVHDKSIVNAMMIFQDLVKVTQDLQMSESRMNNGDETPFVTDFRLLEYDMRNLVEDTMRKEVYAIIGEKYVKNIPPYSVGGINVEAHIYDKDKETGRNLIKLQRVRHCLDRFVKVVIEEVAGKGNSF